MSLQVKSICRSSQLTWDQFLACKNWLEISFWPARTDLRSVLDLRSIYLTCKNWLEISSWPARTDLRSVLDMQELTWDQFTWPARTDLISVLDIYFKFGSIEEQFQTVPCLKNSFKQFRSWFLPGIYMYRNQTQIISLSIDQACCVICCTLSESVAWCKPFNLLHTICCTLSESVANSLVWISCEQFSLNQLQTF